MVVNRVVIVVLRTEEFATGENSDAFGRISSQKEMFWAREFCVKKMTQKNVMNNFMMDLGVNVAFLRF